jgi:phosphatidylinositol-3-phosphatase
MAAPAEYRITEPFVRRWVLLLACAVAAAAVGCGGGTTAPSTPLTGPPAPRVTSVSVSCSPSIISTGATSQCAASVQGTGAFSSAVTWESSSGTISSSGLFTASSALGQATLTATSVEDQSQSGTDSVTVQPPPTITGLTVTCTPTSLFTNATSQCNAQVLGTGAFSTSITWAASAGAIDANGLFTAPGAAARVLVTATSKQDPSRSGTASLTIQYQVPRSTHLVIVMEENQSYSTVVANLAAWSNLNQLISTGALPTNYYADTHPSIGNYFMLTTGQVLTNNDASTQIWNVDNLARRMLAAGVPFRIYAEGVPQGYVGGDTGLYVVRHNPFARLSDIAGDPAVASKTLWPFSQFAADVASNSLPAFSFIVPDLNDDAHNGTPAQADSWLQANVISLLANQAAFADGGDGVLVVNFDEAAESDTTYGGGHIAPVLWGPIVRAGYQQTTTTLYQHQSLLSTVMELLGLANPPGAAAAAPRMDEFFVQR